MTWCVGHLVEMCYPQDYDKSLEKWILETLPFIPESFMYKTIDKVRAQYNVVKKLLNREDIEKIYNCGDAGQEGEYIQRLVYMHAGYNKKATILRVWTDSYTEEEILSKIKNAKPAVHYDGYMHAGFELSIFDYLVGINFSR